MAGRDDGGDDLVSHADGSAAAAPSARQDLAAEDAGHHDAGAGGARIVQGVMFSQNAEPEAPPSADAGGAAPAPGKRAARGRRKQGAKGDPPKSGPARAAEEPGDATDGDSKITRVAAGAG